MSDEYAHQQFPNLHHFSADEYVRPEWWEMPQHRPARACGGTIKAPPRTSDIVTRAMGVIPRRV
jgi:hypothetical protein